MTYFQVFFNAYMLVGLGWAAFFWHYYTQDDHMDRITSNTRRRHENDPETDDMNDRDWRYVAYIALVLMSLINIFAWWLTLPLFIRKMIR